jgi:hypothetical protein
MVDVLCCVSQTIDAQAQVRGATSGQAGTDLPICRQKIADVSSRIV